MLNNKIWELVPLPSDKRALPNKWVFSYAFGGKLDDLISSDTGGEKARLVARGDVRQGGVNYRERYAPVIRLVSLRVLLTWAKIRCFHVEHQDIVSAFLHGDIDDVDIYMRHP